MNSSNFKLTVEVDKQSFTNLNLRPFIAGLLTVVIMKSAMMLGLPMPTLESLGNLFHSPIPEQIQTFDTIRPKLEQKVNTFTLKEDRSLVPAVQASGDYDNATGYAVVDLQTGNILAEKEGDTQRPIASITKVMTAVVALDLASPDEYITINERAAKQIPTKIGVVVGQQMTVEELLQAALLTSANDAAEALKEGIDAKYGEAVFIKAMNEKAKIIGLENTSFANAQGFDDVNNYSTPHDLAILAHYALQKYPLIRDIVSKDYAFLAEDSHHKQYDLYNWNGLLGTYPGAYGIKIGNTGDAGVTTMVAAERDGHHIAVILLGTPGVLERDLWAGQLLDLGFEQVANLEPAEVTEEILREKYSTWKYWN